MFKISELANKNDQTLKGAKYAKKAYCQLQPLFKRLHIKGKEEIGRAISSGADPDYILKSNKEMGKREPVFQWKNGDLVFIPKNERESA